MFCPCGYGEFPFYNKRHPRVFRRSQLRLLPVQGTVMLANIPYYRIRQNPGKFIFPDRTDAIGEHGWHRNSSAVKESISSFPIPKTLKSA
ncbi:MAG: hypothetical protein NVS9B13_10800 [Candidatus Acidiferrum sp.]